MKPWLWFSLLLGLGLLAGCSSPKPTTELSLAFWGDPTEIQFMLEAAQRFEKKHPLIRVKLRHPEQNITYNDFLKQCYEKKNMPDVFFLEIGGFKMFSHKDCCLDLQTFIARDTNFHLEKYYPEIVDEFRDQNRLCVLPRDIAPFACVYYNKKLFEQAGIPYPNENWEWPKDFLPIVQKLTRRNSQGQVQCFGYMDDWMCWEAFALSNGGTLLDNPRQPKRILLDSPECIEAIQFYQDLINTHHVIPRPWERELDSSFGTAIMFTKERTAMFFSGIWKTPFFRAMNDFDWDVVPFPRGPKGPRRFLSGGSGYAISSTCRQPQAAWELVKFLAGEGEQTALARLGLIQPSLMYLADSPVFNDKKKPLHKKFLLAAAHQVEFYPHIYVWEQFMWGYANAAFDALYHGVKPAKELFPQIVDEANKKLFGH